MLFSFHHGCMKLVTDGKWLLNFLVKYTALRMHLSNVMLCNDFVLILNVKARKLKYYDHIMHSEGDNLKKDIIVSAVPG